MTRPFWMSAALSLGLIVTAVAEDEGSISPYDGKDVDLLVKQLGAANFDERESAQSALMHMSPTIIKLLESQLENDDPEIKVRIWLIVEHLKKQKGVGSLLAKGMLTDGKLLIDVKADGSVLIRDVAIQTESLATTIVKAKVSLDTTVQIHADRSLDWKLVSAVLDQVAMVGIKGVSFSSAEK